MKNGLRVKNDIVCVPHNKLLWVVMHASVRMMFMFVLLTSRHYTALSMLILCDSVEQVLFSFGVAGIFSFQDAVGLYVEMQW